MLVEDNGRPVIFGEVLYDCFPDGSKVLGGAPFNVAWHLQAFGLAPLFISRVGRDSQGESIAESMHSWGMDMAGLQWDDAHATGSVQVSIDQGEPHYEIVADTAYDFIACDQLPEIRPSLLYHGTLGLRNPISSAALIELKRLHPPVFVDVNLRPPWWSEDTIEPVLNNASWIKLNEDELTVLEADDLNLNVRAYRFLERNNLDMLIVTRGASGAVAFHRNGFPDSVTPESRLSVVDTVGAGDAFTSVVLTGLLAGWPTRLTLQRAQQFASAVVGLRGATTQDRDFYDQFTRHWELPYS